MNNKNSKKMRPKSSRGLVMAINQGKEIDQRTKIGRSISEIKRSVHENLSESARALLESDVAHAALIQQLCMKKAFADPDKAIRENGKLCMALSSWKKFAVLKKSALLALKKFQPNPEPEDKRTDLGSMVLEVSETDTEP